MEAAATPPLFLKLGGSLITDKRQETTPRLDLLDQLGAEISRFCVDHPKTPLILGHGSGSFGHVPAKRYQTRAGVHTAREWRGFAEVWYQAAALNHRVMTILHHNGLRAVSCPPSAAAVCSSGEIISWDLTPLRSMLEAGLVPVVYGDVVIDRLIGGTILSTEELFVHLARQLHPDRILIAGLEPGVWADYPACTRLFDQITPADKDRLQDTVQGSRATDVTGGMANKVLQMLSLIEEMPRLTVQIFSGEQSARVGEALRGGRAGTTLAHPDLNPF